MSVARIGTVGASANDRHGLEMDKKESERNRLLRIHVTSYGMVAYVRINKLIRKLNFQFFVVISDKLSMYHPHSVSEGMRLSVEFHARHLVNEV